MRKMRHYLFVWIAIAVLLYLGLWCRAALAEEAPAPASGDVLEIASDFIGDGMDKPYAEGYVPAVADGEAKVVLPLRPVDPEAAPAAISVSVNLGDPASPFVFQNYDMRVPLKSGEGEGEPGMYLVEITLSLEESAEGGRFPVAFTCSGQAAGHSFSQTFTVFVTVPAADVPEEPTYDPGSDPGSYDPVGDPVYSGGGSSGGGEPTSEPTQAPQPKLMIISQAVSPAPVPAGDGFSLTVTLKNTSEKVPASNLLITAEGDGADVYAADGQNSAYFPAVKAGETFSFTVSMSSAPEAAPGPKKILLHAGYDGPQGNSYTQDESVAVEIMQPVRFAVDEPDIPSELQAGETWSLPVNVMNLGRSAIRNVSVQVEAPGITAQSTLFLGNLESGTAKKGTLYAFVGPKSEEEGAARYGRTEGMLIVSCEDEAGEAYFEQRPFSLQIEAPVIRSERNFEEPEEEEEPAFQWQLSVLIGAAIAAAVAAVWLHRRAQEKKLDADE